MRQTFILALTSAVVGCGGGASTEPTQSPVIEDDTATLQSAVDKGGTVTLSARTYHLTRTIVLRHSGTVIVGAGPETILDYQPSQGPPQHCGNDRVITTPCAFDDPPPRRIAASIRVGDTSFTAAVAEDLADVHPSDWLLVNVYDSVIGDRIAVDWVQVQSVAGLQVNVTQPFRMAFDATVSWVPKKSGLGFEPVPLVENLELRNFKVSVERTPSTNTAGISIFGALNTTIDGVTVENYNGQPLYCYLSKGVTIRNSRGIGGGVLSEFASSVDVTISDNHFSSNSPGFGLDLGLGFFTVSGNSVDQSANAGIYLLYNVHDGSVVNNQVAQVARTTQDQSAVGLMIWGSQNITVSNDYLAGGDGPNSIGISIRSYAGEVPEPDTGVVLNSNVIGNFVTAVQGP
jgi:Right handed beta helix region